MCRQTDAQKGRQVCVSLVIIHIHSTSPGKTKHFKKESPWKRKPERQAHVHAHELACTHAQLKHMRKRNMQTTCTNTRLTVIVSFPQRDVLFTIVVAILNLLPAHDTTAYSSTQTIKNQPLLRLQNTTSYTTLTTATSAIVAFDATPPTLHIVKPHSGKESM